MEPEFNVEEKIYNEEMLCVARIGDMVIGTDIPPVVVINLRTRTDRRERVIKDMKAIQMPFSFFTAELNENPVRGCLESHINVVKWAKRKGYKQVCIFEDDFVIHGDLAKIPTLPDDWDMAYIGGLCTNVKDWGPDADENKWVRAVVYCDHAYFIRDTVFDFIVEKGWKYEREVDRFFTGEIHDDPDRRVYLSYIQYVTQYDGWSDLDNKNKWGNFSWPKPGEMFNVP